MRNEKVRGIEAHALVAQGRVGGEKNVVDIAYECRYGVPLTPRPGCRTTPDGRMLIAKVNDPVATEALAMISDQEGLPRIPKPVGAQILLLMYVRPEKLASGIILPQVSRDEDVFQGKHGLVLAMGPSAYIDDAFRTFHEPWVRPGDWVVYPAFENSHGRFEFDGIVMATVPDDTMKLIIPAPGLVR